METFIDYNNAIYGFFYKAYIQVLVMHAHKINSTILL